MLVAEFAGGRDVGVVFRYDCAGGVEDAEFFGVDFDDVAVVCGVDVGDDAGFRECVGKGSHAPPSTDAAHLGDVEVFKGLCAAHVDVHVGAQGEFRG